MKITFILMAIMLVACSPGRRTVDDHFISEAEIDNIESFALSDENEEGGGGRWECRETKTGEQTILTEEDIRRQNDGYTGAKRSLAL